MLRVIGDKQCIVNQMFENNDVQFTFLFHSAYFRNPLRESVGIQYNISHRDCLTEKNKSKLRVVGKKQCIVNQILENNDFH